MALKSTIYKIDLQLADLDRNYFKTHALTLALHPSETQERLMVRLIAFTLYASDSLAFGKGLSDPDEPDLWEKDLTGAINLWISVGLPSEKEIRKAAGKSKQVVLVTYGGRGADLWWQQNQKALLKVNNLRVINLSDTLTLASIAARGLSLSCTICEAQILVSYGVGSFNVQPIILK